MVVDRELIAGRNTRQRRRGGSMRPRTHLPLPPEVGIPTKNRNRLQAKQTGLVVRIILIYTLTQQTTITRVQMIVCVCRCISERDIQRAAHGGCSSLEDLQMELGVATCCGRCADCAQSTLDSALSRPGAAPSTPVRAVALAMA
jgi:bacterioferritin-associated ferredoxin